MKTNQENPNAEFIESPDYMHPGVQLIYEYPGPENQMAYSGSSQVLGDFFEFTDYLTPSSQIVLKYRNARQSISEDYYSELLSF
jgi:hypothetical protein